MIAGMQRGLRALELAELRSFVAAADAGTLGRAALRLQISQPALTKRLQALERVVGIALLERSPRGVTLTPGGRRLYEHARTLLANAEEMESVVGTLRAETMPVRLASSHSSTEAFVADALAARHDQPALAVELVTANSGTVRTLVAEGRADIGVVASRERATPNPAIRELHLAHDEIVCAVPPGHRWAQREQITREEFARTPMVVRDRDSNARWAVDAVLRRQRLRVARPLAEAPTPDVARREAVARNAPVLLSRSGLTPSFSIVAIDGLTFPRRYAAVLPAVGRPARQVEALLERLQSTARQLLTVRADR